MLKSSKKYTYLYKYFILLTDVLNVLNWIKKNVYDKQHKNLVVSKDET